MKIAFWSNMHGQAGNTSNMLVSAIIATMKYGYKGAILQSQSAGLNNLQSPLIGIPKKESKSYFDDVGVDALIRNINCRNLEQEYIEDCCISLLGKKINYIPQTQKIRELYIKDIKETIVPILSSLEKYHDIVWVDVETGDNELTRLVLENVDLIVVNLSQNLRQIEDFFEHCKLPKETIYCIGNYDSNSKYNIANISYHYKIPRNNIGMIPYCTEFKDSASSYEIIKYFCINEDCKKGDPNYLFINSITKLVEKILKRVDLG